MPNNVEQKETGRSAENPADLLASPHSFASTSDQDRDLCDPEEKLDQLIEDSFPASDPIPHH